MHLKILIFGIFGISLLSCSPSPDSGAQPQKVLLPVWQQTEYIFYNKTGDRIKIVRVEEGKLRKKDGTVLDRSAGGTRGDDGIFREFILNKNGEQEYVTREYEENSVELEDGECVFTPSYYVLDLRIQGETVCKTFRHGELDPERPCSDEVNQVRGEKGWRNTEKRGEGLFSYVEFYNVINKTNLFEGAEEPRQFDDSFTHSCKMLVPDAYKPWSERVNDPDEAGGKGPIAMEHEELRPL